MRNVIVENKMEGCASVNEQMKAIDQDDAAILCVFENTITPQWDENDGVVLGATDVEHGIISVCNLNKKFLFENVVRHEIGHLLGAEHTAQEPHTLMSPALTEDGIKNLLPFSEESINQMKERIKNHLH